MCVLSLRQGSRNWRGGKACPEELNCGLGGWNCSANNNGEGFVGQWGPCLKV